MKDLFDNVIFKKTINLVRELGDGYNEIVIDIDIDDYTFNTIEIVDNNLFFNRFVDNLEMKNTFDDFDLVQKVKIYRLLYSIKKGT